MLNAHSNNNDKIKIKKIMRPAGLETNPRNTDCKTTVLLTTLRRSVLTSDKKIFYMLKL